MADRTTYTVSEAASLLGVSDTFFYKLLREGVIPHLKLGKRYIIPANKFLAWIDTASIGGEIKCAEA